MLGTDRHTHTHIRPRFKMLATHLFAIKFCTSNPTPNEAGSTLFEPCITNSVQLLHTVNALYDTLNTNKKESNYRAFPENQISLCLWPVSQFTQVEEEVLVFPFQSFLAEFGGALGLFLGFSLMTIWDGMMGMMIWVMALKKVSRK